MIIFDANNIAHRALWTTGDLSYKGLPTGTLYGFVLQVQKIRSLFPKNSYLVFAWDSLNSFRKDVYKEYKARRKDEPITEEEATRREAFYRQMNIIQREVLEPLGYLNHFKEDGYEADDLIASLCQWSSSNKNIVSSTWIISSDHDLYQLLEMATMFQPHKKRNYSKEDFFEEWKIYPDKWAMALAIAGCSSDGVPGVMGVGLATAARFLMGEKIRPTQFDSIRRASRMIERNMKLVSLPFNGRKLVPASFKPKKHVDSESGRKQIKEQFGFNI